MRREFIICLLLTGLTLATFWPAGKLGFIVLDDTAYVSQNTHVQGGITIESMGWAFTTTETGNWHPVTWLSHMLDWQWFGPNAAGHHWVNLGLHIANVLLLFLVLRQMTGAVWRSALVAALFAWHPLRIESVAWISERKDLLSGFFFMLTLLAYARYAHKQSRVESRESRAGSSSLALDPRHWTLDYCLAVLFFTLGLMSKPMLVTVPFVLLLLDVWPLGRVTSDEWRVTRFRIPVPQLSTLIHLLFEKLPFLALSLASGIVTIWAQSNGGAISDLDHIPWDLRCGNALAAYVAYLGEIFWPVNLSIFYPYADVLFWKALGSGLLLVGLSVFFIWRSRFQSYLLVGWCWFVVMLLPVIGILQVGRQSMADRYTYLPSIGLCLMVVWGVAEMASRSKPGRAALSVGAAGLLLACLLDTRYQLRFWRDSVTLFSHSIELRREDNCVGYWILGNVYLESGNLEAAVENYHAALQMAPNFAEVHYSLGVARFGQKQFAEAGIEFGEALRLNANNVDAHKGLGHVLVNQGKYAEAEAEYAKALALRPDDKEIKTALLGATLKADGEKALVNFYEILKSQPTPEVHIQIAAILTIQGKFQDAVEHYRAALQLKPDSADVLNNLAWLLTTCPDTRVRNGAEAVRYAERACELTQYGEPTIVGTLAAAYAEAGRFDEAVATAQKACALATASGQQELLKRNQELMELYRRHEPYRETHRMVEGLNR
jgi:protein O-mannosyl-transferase